jgi:hypothetical protein
MAWSALKYACSAVVQHQQANVVSPLASVCWCLLCTYPKYSIVEIIHGNVSLNSVNLYLFLDSPYGETHLRKTSSSYNLRLFRRISSNRPPSKKITMNLGLVRNVAHKFPNGVLCSLITLFEAGLETAFQQTKECIRQNEQYSYLNIVIMNSNELQQNL